MSTSNSEIRAWLNPFDLSLSDYQLDQIRCYLDLLLRWNARINLTAVDNPEEAVSRHFGESLYLSKLIDAPGRLLDIGTGAGFPGLALKMVFPRDPVVLLEPVAKKRAFLKEVARSCEMHDVEVRGDRIEEFVAGPSVLFSTVTARAVGRVSDLVRLASRCLEPSGRVCLWLGQHQASKIAEQIDLQWAEGASIPGSRERVILVGSVSRGTTGLSALS